MQEKSPLISVIIPCYNAEVYLEECVASVYAQTYRPIEVICIDNNSTDNTFKILQILNDLYPDLIIEEESRSGAPVARNKGLTLAQGEIIQYLDADDVLDPLKLEKQIVGFNNSKIDIVVSDRIIKNEDLTSEIGRLTFEGIETEPINTALSQIIITGNPLYKKSALLKVGGFDESLNSAQDWDLNLRLIFAGAKIKYIPGFYFITRRLSSSLSSDWVKVSIQAAQLLITYKPCLTKATLTGPALSKICFTFYESFLHISDATRKALFYDELLYWSKINNYTYLSKYKRIFARAFGLKVVLYVDSMLTSK